MRGRPPESDDFGFSADGLAQALELLAVHHSDTAAEPVPEHDGLDLPTQLPEHGMGGSAALEALAPVAMGGAARLGHPGYFAHMDPPTPWMSWAAALWAAAFNQNLLHPDTAPVARELEPRVVAWLARAMGMGGGHLVPGSSVANLTALWAARELRGVTQVAASELSHLSVRKAAAILGLKYLPLEADAEHRIRSGLVAELDLERTALVLTAGTVAGGAIDPLDAGQGAAWRHIDAAWAGALRFSQRHRRLLDGLEHADSVSLSTHKWLFQPKESAAVLFADVERAHAAISFGGGYLSVPNIGVLGSHGATALSLAACLLAWGRQGVERLVNHTMEISQQLAKLIAAQQELELWRAPRTGVVLWRPRGQDPREVRDQLTGAFTSLTNVRDQWWLRSVAANPNADPSLVVERVLHAMDVSA